jgi:hypothetical protein
MIGMLSAQAGLSKLDALSMIESANNDRAVGKFGEISRYQLRPQVWRCFTSSRAYSNPAFARNIAAQYFESLESRFRAEAGREPSDFDRYVLWNAGPNYYARLGFDARKVHRVIRERAERYVNLRTMPDTPPMPMLAMARS